MQLAIQLGIVSALPYLAQLIVETGFIKAMLVFLRQLLSGSISFSIFRLQTTSYFFSMDVLYGGAGEGMYVSCVRWVAMNSVCYTVF